VTTRTACVVAVAWLAWVAQAQAQASSPRPSEAGTTRSAAASPRDPWRAGAFELSASVSWLGPSSLGSTAANLTANDTRGSDYRLFSASGDFENALGLEARAGYHLTRVFAIEGGVTFSRPGVSVAIANDAEGAAGVTMSGETVSQFFVDASIVVYPTRRRTAGGLRPFLEFGAGYLRELHGQSGATSGYYVKETGQVYHAGGGVRYFFHAPRTGFLKAYGLRVDGRYYFRNGGFSFDGANANTFTAGAGLVLAF
jgi:hypothetical protein